MELYLYLKQQAWILKAKVKTYRNWWQKTPLFPRDMGNVKKVTITDDKISLDTTLGPLVFDYIKEDNQENNVHAFLFILTEIFIWEIYKTENSIKNKTVIDIGGGIGDSAIYFAYKGAGKVYAYEPSPTRFAAAQKNVKQNNMSEKIEIFNKPYDFRPGLKNALLKIDCDGCEYGVFEKIDFSQFDEILMEYHQGVESINAKLTSAGFKVKSEAVTAKSGYLHATR